MSSINLERRRLVGRALALPGLAALGACSTPLPLVRAPSVDDPSARALFQESAEAHGMAAYRRLNDINVAYDGKWAPLIDRVQPEVVDAGFRGRSEERLMPRRGVNAQAYTGAKGRKQVHWRRGSGRGDDLGAVRVWLNGTQSGDRQALQAAALVAECYGLFLLGPLWLDGRDMTAVRGGEHSVDGRACDIVQLWLQPGLGQVTTDRVELYLDRSDRLMRRLRFTLEGFANTRGAVAEVDTFDHERRFGVVWPMRSFERVLHPISMPAHDWRITGLDVNRNYGAEALEGAAFSGAAAAPARPL